MKRIIFFICLIGLLGGLIPLGVHLFKTNKLEERPVIRVNDLSLSLQEFAFLLAAQIKHFDPLSIKNREIIQHLKNQVSQNYIHKALAHSFLKRQNMDITSKDITHYKKTIAQNYPDSLSLKQALIEQGLDYQTWERQLSLTISERRVIEFLSKQLDSPSEKEMRSYYKTHKETFKQPERVKIHQTILKTKDDAMRIRPFFKRSSAAFKKIASKYSIIPEPLSYQWVERDGPEVYQSAFSIPVGRISPVLKSDLGYHVFKVLKKERESSLKFPKVKDRIRTAILEKRQQAVYVAWLEEEIQTSRIYKDNMLIAAVQVELLRN